jgi:biopolymer transport protein ExbD
MSRFVPAYARQIAGEPQIIGELNMTPLIDVLLVLIVMLIITMPVMTHNIPVDLPGKTPDRSLPQVTHRLELSRGGSLSLDGRAVSDAELPVRLKAMRTDPQAMLTMRTDPEARYERFDQTLAIVKRAGVTRLGFEGNEAMRF